MIESKVKSSQLSSIMTQKLQLSVFENKLSTQMSNLDSKIEEKAAESMLQTEQAKQLLKEEQ